MDVLVVGGAGGMGEWFRGFFESQGWSVDVNDPDAEESVPLTDAGNYDLVLVAVPIDVTPEVIREVAPQMRDGLLMDVTSVKQGPVEAMREHAPEDVEVLGTHPMFGPSVRSLRGQTVILVRERGGELTEEVERLLRSEGANVQYAGAKEHDRMMSVVQGLTHYAYISVGRALEKLDFDVDESRRFMSPVYEVMVDFVGRILNQNPYLYADIQLNQQVEDVHEALLGSARELSDAVEEGDSSAFVDVMHEAARHYGDTRSAQRRSDKIIEASVEEVEALHDSVGEERGLRHIYSDTVHVGTVKRVDAETVVIDDGGETELKTENIELMSSDELRGWKVENLPKRRRDVSVMYPHELDRDVLESVVLGSHQDVVGVEVFDVYNGDAIPSGSVSYGLRLRILDDGGVSDAIDSVEWLLEGLGGEVR